MHCARGQCSRTLGNFLPLRSSTGCGTLIPCCVTRVCTIGGGCSGTRVMTRGCLSTCPRGRRTTRVCQVLKSTCCRFKSCRGTITSFQGCLRGRGAPQESTLCVLKLSCFRANMFSGTTRALKRIAARDSTLARGTCLRVKLTCLRLTRGGGTHVTFRRTTTSGTGLGVGRRTTCGCTLYVRRASCSTFKRSMAIFRGFLGRFPGSRCTRVMDDCLMRICVGAQDCRTTLGSVSHVTRPNGHVLRTGRHVLFRLNARTFTGARFRRTVNCFSHSLKLKRCGHRAGTSTLC